MQLTEKQILNALDVVVDHELHESIVKLGFVRNIKISDDNDVTFDLFLTKPDCPSKARFKKQCEKIILGLGASSIKITPKADPKASKQQQPAFNNAFLEEVSNIVGVASGKGGVGKSMVTANLAMALSLTGAKVGILDADIYGPSMGLMFGIQKAPVVHDDRTISPVLAKGGVSIVSMCMFADPSQATIWRGPMVSQMIQNFVHRVRWGKLDYLLIDFPPGTGDIQLTLTQNCPLTGSVVVTTPQEVALADCRKGLSMFDSVGVPVVGIVENMSYFICDKCKKAHYIFRQGGGERIAKSLGVPLLGKIPLEPALADCGDLGIPGVLRYPNAVSSKEFVSVAAQVIKSLAQFKAIGKSNLDHFNMEWKDIPTEEV